MTAGSGLALGVSVVWLSLLVLIPLAAVLVSAAGLGLGGFWDVVTQPQTAAALRLTVVESLAVTPLNVVMGTMLAWVLVRDRFWGKRLLDIFIDVPFALPTIVAGLVLLTLYGPKSPLGVNVANTRRAVFLALAFVTLPFVVRTVQPVLESLERDVEEAAASLGAGRLTTFRRVILPSLIPAIAAGAALAFARAISEYGSLVLLSGNLPCRTEVASVRVYLHPGRQPRLGLRDRRDPAARRAAGHRRCSTSSRGGWPAVATGTYCDAIPPPVRWGLRRDHRRLRRPAGGLADGAGLPERPRRGLGAMLESLREPEVAHALYLTVYITVFAVLINLVFGLTISILLVRYDFPGKRMLSARCSTYPCRSRRSWSASRSCWSTTAGTAGSARRWRTPASRSSSPRPA